MLLGYGYMKNNLGHLGGYPTHRDAAYDSRKKSSRKKSPETLNLTLSLT